MRFVDSKTDARIDGDDSELEDLDRVHVQFPDLRADVE
jgi:hypothetical protein